MATRARLVVLGILGQLPLAGVVWQILHYLEGFRRLGFDVYYVEDTGNWPYDPEQNTVTDDCTYAVDLLGQLMTRYGLSDRWAYRLGTGGRQTFGLSESQLHQLFKRADLLVNITGSTVLRTEHLQVPVRIYLETDPVLPQIEIAKGNEFYIGLLNAHTHHFTFGENLGAPDCNVPVESITYRATRQPIILDWWNCTKNSRSSGASDSLADCFTTIASWRQSNKDVELQGETYTWSKHHEFIKFVDLPLCTSQPLELALALKGNWQDQAWMCLHKEDVEAIELLKSHHWRVINGLVLSKDILSYRDYILRSRGEFTVAKDQNVRLRSGWFSDRSACYLAAGRPVITQDTAFGKFLPTGRGLFSFQTVDEIVAALDAITADYVAHSRAAREIAEEYFKAETVLARLLADCGV